MLTENERGRIYDRFRDRVVFPIRDTKGRVIGFGGRVLRDTDGPKYINSPETPIFHKSEELYGVFEARQALRQIDRLVLVEGYMDVVALAVAGVANAVATLGTASNEAHFRKLFRYTSEVVCCFDGDRAGRQAAWRAVGKRLAPSLGQQAATLGVSTRWRRSGQLRTSARQVGVRGLSRQRHAGRVVPI